MSEHLVRPSHLIKPNRYQNTDMRNVITCPQTRIHEFQMSNILRIWYIEDSYDMIDGSCIYEFLSQCKYLSFDDFFLISMTNVSEPVLHGLQLFCLIWYYSSLELGCFH